MGIHLFEKIYCDKWSETGRYFIPIFVQLDQLSVKLNQESIGCFVGGKLVNHLMYADDLVLIVHRAEAYKDC